MKKVYICQLNKREKLEVYKKIKAALLEHDCFSYEYIRAAMDSKTTDIY